MEEGRIMSIYARLADRISDIYGLCLAPHTEDRGFVKVFRKLLCDEEAAIAIQLNNELQSISEIENTTGVSTEELIVTLESLAKKGILYEEIRGSEKYYQLMSFVPGILEALVGVSDDPEIAEYLQDYADEIKAITEESKERIIPVNCKINIEIQRATMSEIELYLRDTNKFAVMDCLCRTVNKVNGNECGHPIKDMCVLIGDYVDYYVRIGNARLVTKEEIHQILLYAEQQGLFHEIYPIENSNSVFICNCCTCGCMFMDLANRINCFLQYENSVKINKETCTKCGQCIDNCPQHVFSWSDDGKEIKVDETQCISCRLCVVLCMTKAIEIAEKE